MFLTPEQTGGPLVFALRRGNRYLAFEHGRTGYSIREFNINQLALALGQDAGDTWQEHERLILLACREGRLFECLNSGIEIQEVNNASNQSY